MDGDTHWKTASTGTAKKTTPTDLSDWIGRNETQTGCVPATLARVIHATLARPGEACPDTGDIMPALWHWYAFPPAVGMDELSKDGHPARGGFLPPVPYERRMWAGGNIHFYADLCVGEEIEKRSTIISVEEKSGSTGGMVFVGVEHEIYGAAGLAVRETQSIVYLPIPAEFSPPPGKPGPTKDLAINERQAISTPLLFRYSAITFNAHRIHYDLPYAQEIEKYPGLVVHGPLQANLLVSAATAWKGRRPDHFRFRGVHPMFHDSDLSIRATQSDCGGLKMCTIAEAGHRGMDATADWEV
ncbi:MAG: MaoC family dehydratase N-terminal domain-containing protein [Dinoroseobacter sp.]|nr:MaoC family dehydratase N-terminal domain-containing protein [Dinoroseobacter sp.]